MDIGKEIAALSQDERMVVAPNPLDISNLSTEEVLLIQQLQKAIMETVEENISFTKEIGRLLHKIDIDLKLLPDDIKEGLDKLVVLLKNEKLSEINETALRVARYRKFLEEKRRHRQERLIFKLYSEMVTRNADLDTKVEQLQGAVSSLEISVDNDEKEKENLECKNAYLAAKLKEYEQTVEKLESNIEDTETNLHPQKILSKYKAYLEKRSVLAEVTQCLKRYGKLPPNLTEAKLVVEDKKKEYENLEQELLEKTT